MNTLCTPFNIILRDFKIANETGITTVQHKHKKILKLKGKRHISSVHSAVRVSLVTVVYCMSPTGHFIRYLYFKENIWNQNWWMAHRLDQSTRAIHRVGYRARFSSSSFFISSNTQSLKKMRDPVIWVRTGTIHTQETWRSLI